ncbi:MAG: hypothetical protein OEV08_08725 [Nitrospira sp.]|nr:hypothetical protein [Nitrospira sp.]
MTENRSQKMQRIWRLSESPARDYLWGGLLIVLGALTILGMFYLFGL